jgi:hypothetical protein
MVLLLRHRTCLCSPYRDRAAELECSPPSPRCIPKPTRPEPPPPGGRFDHDCPWISNAVGAGNHAYFVGFVALVTVCLASWDYLCISHLAATAYAALPPRCPGGAAHHAPRRAEASLAGQAGLAAEFLGNGTGAGDGAGLPAAGAGGRPLCLPPAPFEVMMWCLWGRPGEVVLLWIYLLYAFFTVCMSVVGPARYRRCVLRAGYSESRLRREHGRASAFPLHASFTVCIAATAVQWRPRLSPPACHL